MNYWLEYIMMKKVIYVIEDVENVQFRYRCVNVVEAAKESEKYDVNFVLKNENEKIDFENIDLLVIERQTAKDNLLLNLINKAKSNGVKVLFDLDDLVFDYNDFRLMVDTVREKNIFYWAGYFWGIRRIAKKVDGFLTTNDFLGKKLKRSFGKDYKVIPNSLNNEQVKISEECIKSKKQHKGFIIGYFSGSPTHAKDFKMVEPEIVKFLENHEDVKLRIVGYMDFSEQMQRLVKSKRIEILDLVDFRKLQRLMSEVDVNIAPLVVNDFTNCKSELKFFEAAVVETTTIASPTYTFKKAISDGENGLLAQQGEWYDKLEYLYKNPKENKKIAKEAKKYALKHYYGEEFLQEVEEAYDYFAK